VGDWVFANRLGRPVHPTEDHRAGKALLREAKVLDARLHDARRTAATMLLVLKVPLPAVMDIMGWSDDRQALYARAARTGDLDRGRGWCPDVGEDR